jgi:FecR protein
MWPVGLDDTLDNSCPELGHTLSQPGRDTSAMQREIGGSRPFHPTILSQTPAVRPAQPVTNSGNTECYCIVTRNLEYRHTVLVRASIIATVRLGRCSSSKAFVDQRSPTNKEDANMRKPLLFKAITLLSLLLLPATVLAQANDATNTDTGSSKVRIVRLSLVKGAVEIDRSNGRGFEPAIANLPIVEQNQLRTGVGIAEVEFEDNSSMRIAPNSLVEFPRLERSASGATVSSVHVIKGTAFISLLKPQSGKAPVNQFELVFGARKLNLDPSTHVRLDLEGTQAKLAVLDGSVHVDGANGSVSIAKKKTATFSMFDPAEPTVAKDIASTPYDAWDHNAASYHSNVGALSAINSPYSYGLSDLSYYGSFVNGGGGCGSMWRPYFASAGWDPFANGSWAWYQGAGYSWVSPYPWAWTPYHSGSWAYCDNVGWGWMPGGGGWYGLNNVAAITPSIAHGPIQAPHLPAHPPLPHAPSMIAVNTKPIAQSEIASSTSFVFRKDSAGLGVPRGTLGHLGKFSNESINRGTAKTAIYTAAPQTGRPNGGMTMSESMGVSIHRGYAPSSPSYSHESFNTSSGGSSGNIGSSSARSTSVSAPSAPSAPSGGGGVRK